MAKKKLTQKKAKEILHDKSVHGKPLTDKQRKFFGAIAGGATPYAQNGIEGTMGGLTDKGFNYNGAWGGPSMQNGGIFGQLTFLEPTSKKLPEGYNPIARGYSTEYATSIGGEDGELAYLIPTFKYGELLTDPKTEFLRTGEHLGGPFKTWQEADEWDRTVRHPYVEKGQSIPSPYRRWGTEYQMGGNLPGATGMMYARVGAPSNGKYAKKTKASAQDGDMIYYQHGLDFKPKTISQKGTKITSDLSGFTVRKPIYDVITNPKTQQTQTAQDISAKKWIAEAPKRELQQRVAKDVSNQIRSASAIPTDPNRRMDLNRQYAASTGRVYNETTGDVTERYPESLNKVGDRVYENMIEPALYAEMAMSAAPLLGQGLKALGKYAVENTALKNAYKINPWAFKPSETNWYRQVGKSAIDDALETGLVREAGEEVSPRMLQEFEDQLIRLQGTGMEAMLATRRPASPFFLKGELFYPMGRKPIITKSGKISKNPAGKGSADYLIETGLPNESFQPAYVKGMSLGVPTEIGQTAILKPNPSLRDIQNFNLYKQDWLQGYKRINSPRPVNSFKSEIDWGKWNPETPNYPELISEYNTIEQTTKANGTWMKNADGTAFTGTPEQFIQQQSSYFKNAFPEGFNRTYRGANNNATFRGNLASSDNPNVGAVFAGNKNSAVPRYGSFDRVIRPEETGPTYQGTPGYMELAYKPSNNSVNFSAGFSNWESIDRSLLPGPHSNMKAVTQTARENPSIVTTDDIAQYIQNNDVDYAKISNIDDGTLFGEEVIYNHKPNNYLKSLWHNVGFFDMTNPNIYKGLAPLAIGAAAVDKKEDGGVITDPMGQWSHPGEITRIPGTDITMSGVPYPVLGVSDTGDTQMMFPDEDYKFDGSYVTEYPMAKNGSIQDKGQLKKLDQLTNFTNYNKMAKKGIKKAQTGTIAELSKQMGLNLANYKKGMFDSPTGSITKTQTEQLGFDSLGNRIGGGSLNAAGLISAGSDVIKGFQQLKQDRQNYRKAKQFSKLSDVTAKAATTRDQPPVRRYVRPEDMLFANENMNANPYGTGYDVLSSAENGMQIGGNLTEIQNMYNPGTLYNDLGYEPLDESSRVKQFQKGGNIFSSDFFSGVTAADTGAFGGFLGSAIGGNRGRTSGAGSIGKGLGTVAGTIIGGPVGGMIGSAAGGFLGDLIGGQQAAKTQQLMDQAQRKIEQATILQGVGGLQNQFSAFMQNGGEASGLKYLSHDWQPQVITTFGEHKLKDLLAPPNDADMLRAGGEIRNIRANYMSDDERMSMMQMGGELQTHWGGDAETMSYNPYLGETVMFKGQSHAESDGSGRTGIGITFGESPVEVERGEPAVKLKDGGTGQDSLVVYGDMKIPNYGVSELNDPKAKGMKFKHYVKSLSEQEPKQSKKIEKALDLLESTKGDSPFDLLKINSAQATITGADMKLRDIANKKRTAAGIQSAILDTAEELGLESSDLAKGKIKNIKGKKNQAQDGAIKFPSHELVQIPTTPAGPFKFGPYKINQIEPDFTTRWDDYVYNKPMQVTSPYASPEAEARAKQKVASKKVAETSTAEETPTQAKQPGFVKQLAREILPYVRPTNQMPLDPSQLSGEMFALAANTLDPVQAQTYQPMLKTLPAKRSAQTALNQNQLTFNALARQVGGNPQALAQLAAQKYDADKQVINQIEDYNRAAEAQTIGENLATLNDSTLKNLAILDTQYQRQTAAKSATKAQAQAALSSIASKIAQNKLENRTLGVYENMYNYRFTPSGVAYNVNAPAEFSIPNVADYSSEELLKLYNEKKQKESKKTATARNGNIVKAIKNL